MSNDKMIDNILEWEKMRLTDDDKAAVNAAQQILESRKLGYVLIIGKEGVNECLGVPSDNLCGKRAEHNRLVFSRVFIELMATLEKKV